PGRDRCAVLRSHGCLRLLDRGHCARQIPRVRLAPAHERRCERARARADGLRGRPRHPRVATDQAAAAGTAESAPSLLGRLLMKLPSAAVLALGACLAPVAHATDWEIDLDMRLLSSDGQRSYLDGGTDTLRF